MRRWQVVLWAFGILIALVALYLALALLRVDTNLVVAVITAAAAAFAGVSALASVQAARASSATARDAARALALTSKPAPTLNLTAEYDVTGERVYKLTVAAGAHPMTRAVVSWGLRDHRHGSMPLSAMDDYLGTTYTHLIKPGPTDRGTDWLAIDFWGANSTSIGWRRLSSFTTDPHNPNGPGGILYDPNPKVEPEIEI